MILSCIKHDDTKPRICVVTTPRPKAGVIPLSNLVDVLRPLSSYLYVITGNDAAEVFNGRGDIHGHVIINRVAGPMILQALGYILLQLKISYHVLRASGKADLFIFFEGECLLLPVLSARILRKPVVLSLASSMPSIIDADRNAPAIFKVFKWMEIANYKLSQRIVLFSHRLIKDWNLDEYRDKITVAYNHFLDLSAFRSEGTSRRYLVGYLGRLDAEKGALNFAGAIPLISEAFSDAKFLIGGDGQMRDAISLRIDASKSNVTMPGWIPHEDLPRYLNDLKVVVMPSYTEGLPNIMLEAMACGAVVLATPVGAIPDMIKDGETGFLMEDNSPECIASNVIRTLKSPHLGRIAENARALIEQNFAYDMALEHWRAVLEGI